MSSIVLIDDNDKLLAQCVKTLQPLGHVVVCPQDSDSFDPLEGSSSVELVIISISKKSHTAIETFKELQNKHSKLEGILLVEKGDFEGVVKGVNSGMSRVCVKPIEMSELKTLAAEILKSRGVSEEATRMSALLPLYKLGQKLLHVLNEDEIYEELAEIILTEFGAPTVSVMMLDESKGTLKIVAHRGLDKQYVENLQIEPGERIAGKVFETNAPAILNRDSQSDTPFSSLLVRPELSAAISFPITLKDKVVGVINVSETEKECSFNESDLEMLSIISDQAMMALGNIRSLKAREEQRRVRTLLEQYVSPEVSKLLVESRRELMDVGNIQDLTVLFADIRNFTLLVQRISARQLREFLNMFFELLTSVVFSHKGMLDKFMGDAALAVFGAPVKLSNKTKTAVRVAIELEKKFKDLQYYWMEVNPVFKDISLGIGISRGPLFLGNIGSSKRVDYTVIGTEVNMAQRLASELDFGHVLLTKEACDELGGDHETECLGPMLLRGMTTEVEVFKLLDD